MRNYIILNGQNSNSISGLLIQSLAPISKPLMRTEIEEIDGRDGDITTKLGYSAYDKQITIGLYGNYDINEVIAYFNSEGTVIFSNEPDKYYNYQIAAQIDFERLVRYKTATVTMHCQPFKYSATEGTEIFGASSNLVTIPDFSRTTNGITVSVANNIMTVSGKGSAATEFYVPIDTLSLAAGSYTMTAIGSGTAPEACSLRVIYDSPSSANSFGGNYVTLKNNTDVSLSATLSATKTYNYVYLYIAGGKNMNFTLNLQIVDQAQATVSDEGTNLVLEGSAEAPFSQFDLKGNTDQQTYSGKNLLKPYAKTATASDVGLDATLNYDGSITISGTASADTWLEFGFKFGFGTQRQSTALYSLDSSSTYTLSTTRTGTQTGNCRLYVQSASSGTEKSAAIGNSTSFSGADGIYRSWLRITSGASFTNVTIYPQLEKSSSATAWEKYVGGAASPNSDYPQAVKVVTGENAIKVNGKNMLKILSSSLNDTKNGVTASYDENTGIVTLNGTCTTDNTVFALSPNSVILSLNGTYTLSYEVVGGTISKPSGKIARIQLQKAGYADSIYLGIAGEPYFITATQPYDYPYKNIRVDNGVVFNNYKIRIQLEKSSQATDWEAYQEQSYPISLGSIELCKLTDDHKDRIFKNADKWYKHKEIGKYVLTGASSENWYFSGDNCMKINGLDTTLQYPEMSADYAFSGLLTTQLYSNYGTVAAAQSVYSGAASSVGLGNKDGGGGNTDAMYVSKGNVTSITNWRAILGATPLICYYVLRTPVDEEITNEALIEQLDDIADHAHAYKERTHVTALAATGNMPHIIAAAVTANMGDITVTNSGNFISKPTMTIFGSGDIGVYLNGIQLFQIALGDAEYITIDCAAMEAYKDTLETLQNRLVTGDYSNFVLNPGDNTISFTGSVTKFEISNYSRWL